MARSWKLLGLGAALALVTGAAQAENLDAGKSAAALFTANCAACHSSPRGLAKDRGSGGLASYLQEHYTSSPQTAAALAAYLVANPGNPRGKQAAPTVRNPGAPDERGSKQGEAKSERETRAPHTATTRPDSMIEPTEQKRSNTESAKGHAKRQQTKQEAPTAPAASAAEPPAAAPAQPAAPAAPAAAPVAAAPPPVDQSAFSAPSP
jgi:hypothetical protein